MKTRMLGNNLEVSAPVGRPRVRMLALFPALLLCGCYPSVHKVWRVTVPGAEYRKDTCDGSVLAYYEYNGIFVSVWLGTSGYPMLGFYVPKGSTIQVNDRILRVRSVSSTGTTEQSLELSASVAGFVAAKGSEYRSGGATRMASDNFGPHIGSADPTVLAQYLFGAKSPISSDTSGGTFTLPSLTINGQRYASQDVPFTRDTFVGLLPVNC